MCSDIARIDPRGASFPRLNDGPEGVLIRLTVSDEAPDATAIARAVEVLRAGGLVAFPTDTLYGIAADPTSDRAVDKLFRIKGRDARSAVPLIAADEGQARAVGEFGERETRLARRFWPGPLSIVVRATPGLSRAVVGADETIAIRVPAQSVARALARAFGFCITATSANRSGASAAASADAVVDMLPGLDLLLDSGPARGGPPSTIVAFDADGPVLIRAGAVAWDRVLKSCR